MRCARLKYADNILCSFIKRGVREKWMMKETKWYFLIYHISAACLSSIKLCFSEIHCNHFGHLNYFYPLQFLPRPFLKTYSLLASPILELRTHLYTSLATRKSKLFSSLIISFLLSDTTIIIPLQDVSIFVYALADNNTIKCHLCPAIQEKHKLGSSYIVFNTANIK